ncbi:DUF2946 family protein [Deinococcus maricopensis]|uniref:DUF2946 family protein n=1 Tax=Deinococcus maricopensis TaxID=309887 RepID=UPI0005C20BCE|nr:DUF2946 family protein [Deinococcus maricopensis]
MLRRVGSRRLPLWWAALLCVLASFAYTVRTAAPTVTSAGVGSVAVMAAHADEAQAVAHVGDERPGMVMAEGECPGEHAGGHGADPLRSGSPNAPPSGHDHGAHCPFCFTHAFGVEGLAFAWVPAPGVRAAHGRPSRVRVFVGAWAHADARAPPALRG